MTNVPSSDSGDALALLVHAYSDGELDPANALAKASDHTRAKSRCCIR